MRRASLIATVLAGAALIAGCGGGGDGDEEAEEREPQGLRGLVAGGKAAPGKPDPAWTVRCEVIAEGAPPCRAGDFVPAVVQRPDAQRVQADGAAWMGVSPAAAGAPVAGEPRYQYTYRTRFDLTDLDPGSATLTVTWSAADEFAGWRVNDGDLTGADAAGDVAQVTRQTTIGADDADFRDGANTLELVVRGDGEGDGLLVAGLYGSALPR